MEDPVIKTMSTELREWFALAIVGMIWADGRVDKTELAYLKNIIGFLKDKSLINSMLVMLKKGDVPPLKDVSADLQHAGYIMSQLTLLSIVDEELAPDEEKFLVQVAKKLNLPAGVSERFLSHARKQVKGKKYPGKLTVADKELEVNCFGLSENECLAYSAQAINPHARIRLSYKKGKSDKGQDEFFDAIAGKNSWCRPIKSRFGKFVVKIVYQQGLQENQGLELTKNPLLKKEKALETLKPSNNSLLGFYVQCWVCGKKNIPFWMLRTKSMNTQNNMFGIPVYQKPKTDKEFCDYNLLQIAICPQCLFASNQMDHFKKQQGKEIPTSFDTHAFTVEWNKSLPLREQLRGKNPGWLKSEERSAKQAIASYNLGLMTSDHLASTAKEEKALEHQRRSVSYLLIQAELAMNAGNREKAEKNIMKVEERLTGIFPSLSQAPAIRSAFVLAIIKIYFKKYDEAGEYLNFLKNFERSKSVAAGSPEFRVLNQVTKPADIAWQERAEYAHDVLSDFHLE